MTTLVDAGPLYALINPREHYHERAVEQVEQVSGPLVTCEAALSEAFYLLSRSVSVGQARVNQSKLLDLLDAGAVVVAFSYADHIARVNELMRTYANVPMSFAGACLVRMTELEAEREVFSTDGDFRVYRRRGDAPIPVRLPP